MIPTLFNSRYVASALVLLLIGGGLYLFYSLSGSERASVETLGPRYNAVPQTASERIWDDSLSRKIPITLGDTLFRPVFLDRGRNGDIYILDKGDGDRVKQFSLSGRFAGSYGAGEGGGPGEHLNLSYFDVGPDGKVWTVDGELGRISIFKPDGSLNTLFKLDNPPFRIAVTDTKRAVIRFQHSTRLVEITLAGQVTDTLAALIDRPLQGAYVYSERIYPHPNEASIIRLQRFLSEFLVYDRKDQIAFARKLIDPIPLPLRWGEARHGKRLVLNWPELPVYGGEAAFTDSTMHVLRHYRKPERKEIIDIYDLASGEYLKSYRGPDILRDAAIVNDTVVVLMDTTIKVYKHL